MAYTTIDNPTDYFNTTAYTGNGSAGRNLTTGTFQPDWVWIKSRSDTDNHRLIDAVRGATKHLESDGTGAEQTSSNVTAFTSTGITLSSNGAVNANGETYVVWSWLGANTTVSNTAGTITSTVSANTTAGFSIVSYTGNGSAGATVGHGLGVAPKMVILKVRNTTGNWRVGNISASSNFSEVLNLNLTNAKGLANSIFNSTAPSSTVFTLGDEGDANGNGNTFVAYCFAEVKGYSKFGSYTGNGDANGTFVYTGFKPAFVMRKRTDSTADWRIDDSKRDGYNVIPFTLFPNLNNAETTNSGYNVDLLSNGFKSRATSVNQNASGGTYIYMAFAENPFVSSSGIPTTAR